jgi:solute carrier family 25 carnitine/acylcarnitine transporter 20/29
MFAAPHQRAQTSSKGKYKNTIDILRQTIAKEGFFALYKGENQRTSPSRPRATHDSFACANPQGMASPLMGIAAVNSLLFTAYGVSKRIISPYPDLSLGQIAAAGGMAGAANAVLASPVGCSPSHLRLDRRRN